MHATKSKLVRAVKSECARIKGDIAGQMDQFGADEDQRAAIVCQNALRTCMEAAIDQAIPFSAALPVELAVRLASYAISVLPIEQHEAALSAVAASLPAAHRARIAKGVMIQTTWASDGELPEGATKQ